MSSAAFFAGAPVTRGLITVICGLTVFIVITSLEDLLIFQNVDHNVPLTNLYRPITNALFFTTFSEIFFGSLLLYQCRVLERWYGSYKFATLICLSAAISIGIQFISVISFGLINVVGPYGIIYTLATLFAVKVPATSRVTIGFVQASDKIYFYLLWLTFILLRKFTTIPTLIASIIFAGLYHYNILSIQYFRIPAFFRVIGEKYIAPLLNIDLKVSRQLRPTATRTLRQPAPVHNYMVNEFVRNLQAQNMQYIPPANGAAPFPHATPAAFHHGFAAPPMGGAPVNGNQMEDNITQLTGMGFSRDEAVFALQQTGNNLQMATNILLGS